MRTTPSAADTATPSHLSPSRTVVVLLVGLPGAGKSTLLHRLVHSHTHSRTAASASPCTRDVTVTAAVRLDDYYLDCCDNECGTDEGKECGLVDHTSVSSFEPLVWRTASQRMFDDVHRHVSDALTAQGGASAVSDRDLSDAPMMQLIVVEDNMHYYSMRERYWRLCRDVTQRHTGHPHSLALLEVRLYVPLHVCIARNAHRARSEEADWAHNDATGRAASADERRRGRVVVPERVIHAMQRSFDHGRCTRPRGKHVEHHHGKSTTTVAAGVHACCAHAASRHGANEEGGNDETNTRDSSYAVGGSHSVHGPTFCAPHSSTAERDVVADVTTEVGCWGVVRTPQPWALCVLLPRAGTDSTTNTEHVGKESPTSSCLLCTRDDAITSQEPSSMWTGQEQVHHLLALLHADVLTDALDAQGLKLRAPCADVGDAVSACTPSPDSLVHQLDLALRAVVRELCMDESRRRRVGADAVGATGDLSWIHELKKSTLTDFRARLHAMADGVCPDGGAYRDVGIEHRRRHEYDATMQRFNEAVRMHHVAARMLNRSAVDATSCSTKKKAM